MKARNREIAPKVVPAQPLPPPPWSTRDWLWSLLLVLAIVATYQPVWFCGFCWDDDLVLTSNPVIVGPLGLKEIWTTSAADICPLLLTTFWVEHALWGLAPLPYHLVNVLLHAACAVLLWRILRALQVPGAWLGAALWALHPVQVESVAAVCEMKNTQSGLFYLLAILFFLRWLKASPLPAHTRLDWNYALTLLFAALALASKSSTVILPAVLCLCAWWTEGRWHWRNLLHVAPIVLLSLAASLATLWTQGLQLTPETQTGARSWPERLVIAGDDLWFYLGKLLWPHPLILMYPRWTIDASRWTSYLPLLAVLLLLVALWRLRHTRLRPGFFVLAYFLVALLPVLGFVSLIWFWNAFVADHLQYLAGMAPLALAAAGLTRLADLALPKKPWLPAILAAPLLLVLALVSWHRVWAFQNEETIWPDTLAQNPTYWMGYTILGNDYLHHDRTDEAIALYQKSLALCPNFDKAHNNLGVALYHEGRVDDAIAQYRMALALNPAYIDSYNDLGLALVHQGHLDDAILQFRKALALDPNYPKAHHNLAFALMLKGQIDDAIPHYRKALALDPTYLDARYHLGLALLQSGQTDDAIDQFTAALQIDPNLADASYNLGLALEQKGREDDAIASYQKTLQIDPHYYQAHNNLGFALVKLGRLADAMAHYRAALALEPRDAEAHNNLGVALAQTGHLPDAILEFQQALRLNPNYPSAQTNLAKIQALAHSKPAP